jgi:small neutral amino acid transporter SnatA (MarC family)
VGVVLLFFSFLCCVLCYVCLRIVSCAIHVASVSGLSILDRSFGFL